jgi:autotransporter-associated beta strand protein
MILPAAPSHAANGADTWTGLGPDGNWSTALNWLGANTPPISGDSLIFDGVSNLSTNNDIAFTTGTGGGPTYTGLTFTAAAGAFTLAGNSFILAGDINDNSLNAQTINLTASPLPTPTGTNYGLVFNGGTSNVNVISGGSLSLGTVVFGNNAPYVNNTTASPAQSNSVTTLNINNNGVTATSLVVQTNTSAANTITIPTGVTFNMSGGGNNSAIVVIGTPSILTTNSSNATTLVVSGAGTWNISNTNGNFDVGVGSGNNSTTGFNAQLDMRNLANFVYNTGTAGTGNFYVGFGTRPTATIHLANTSNTITAQDMQIGNSAQTPGFTSLGTNNNAGGTSTMFLGSGTNVFNLGGNLILGNSKGVGVMQFETAAGTLVINGKDPAGNPSQLPSVTVGRESSGSGSTGTNQMLLAGHQVTISANSLIVGANAGSSSSSTGVLTFDTGTITTNTLQIGVHSASSGSAIGTFTMGGTTPNNTATGVLNVNTTFNLANGTIAGTATGTFTLNGGTANINADILDASTLGTHTTTLNLAGGTLNMMGHAIGSASAPITNVNLVAGGGSATLKNLGGTGMTSSANTGGGLAMNGIGQINLDGVNAYTGDTNINSGTLSLIGSMTGGGNVNVNTGGILIGNGDGTTTGVMGNLSVAGGTVHPGIANGDIAKLTSTGLTVHNGALAIDLGAAFSSDRLIDNGALTIGDTNASMLTLTLSGPVATGTPYEIIDYTGALTKNADFVVSGPLGFNYALDYGTAGKVFLDVTPTNNVLTWTGAADQTTWDFAAANFTKGAGNIAYTDPTPAVFDDTAPANATTINITATVSPSTVSVSSNTNNYTFKGAGAIAGAGTLVKDGTSTLTIINNNTYSGGTTISNGTIQVGNGGATGSLGSGAITNNATLAYNRSDTVTVGNTITGTGTLQQLGPGTLILTGSNSYGPTVISAGTLQVGNGGTSGTLGGGTVTDNGTLAFNRSDDLTVSNNISGTGGVGSLAANTLTLAGSNSFTGPVTLASGTTVKVAASNSIGATTGVVGNVTVAGGATFDVGGLAANTLNFGTRNFHIQGTGTASSAGALANSTAAQQNAVFNFITLDGDATIGGSRMDIGRNVPNGKLDLAGHTLTTAMTGTGNVIFGILDTVTVTSGQIVVTLPAGQTNSGLDIERGASVPADGSGSTITFQAGTSFESFESKPGLVTRPMIFMGNNFIGAGSGVLATIDSPMLLKGDVTMEASNSGIPTPGNNNPIALKGNITEDAPHAVTKVGVNTVTLSGNNTFSGGLALNGGTLISTTGSSLGAAASAVTIGNATLTLNGTFSVPNPMVLNDGNSTIDVTAGNTATLTGAISGGGGALIKGTASGTLVLAQGAAGATLPGDATVNGGALNVSGTTPLNVPGTLTVNDLTSVTLLSGPTRLTHQVNNLSMNGSGNLDLNNHEMLTNTDPNTIKGYLTQAYDPNGNADWGKPGLTSSVAKSNPTSFSVGYAFGGDQSAQDAGVTTKGGTPITATQTIVRPVLTGDANMDGRVDFFDITQILGYKYNTGQPASYTDGDLDYNGQVDFFDIVLLLSANYNSGQSYLGAHSGTPALSHGASTASTTIGTGGDGKPDFVYDPNTGDLKFLIDGKSVATFISSLYIGSASGKLKPGGASAAMANSVGATLTTTEIAGAMPNSPGFTNGFDLGNILPTGLTNAQITADLTVAYQVLDAGGLQAADVVVPEPAGLALLGLAGVALLRRGAGRRRR